MPVRCPSTHGLRRRLEPLHLATQREDAPAILASQDDEHFVWSNEADAALHELKHLLQAAPALAEPQDKEPMLLYTATTSRVISVVMVVERKEEGHKYPVQRSVYYLSEILSASKERYPQYQKLVYAVFMAQWRLWHYF
jgi:hypothetical protein